MIKKQIIDILEQDSRTTSKEIATMLNISVEEVETNIKQMEADKVIVKYTAIVNKEKVSGSVQGVEAFIEVQVKPERDKGFDSIAERLYSFPEVKSLYLMSGGYDLLVVIQGANLNDIASFVYQKLATLENVKSTRTHFLLKKYKENGITFEKTEIERLAITL
ncbi:MAG: Lrp/AsnC family transcriptional regulator [Candidatus Margulisiibacteriota bacterium]|nr:MAG: AsnC family transcriptional regulator [Candidatus Margulisbacteria bacterium GWD2_39_127]OGI02956.1 MAG: AsnC family transcriptional regulator [Candidatus Margulisbacteria bacterium GWF2_38_17]OGI09451.1 MAG: AsnC family transcriptional regulator [Candidatus Margulisbacteria bacterium GWE2_39_32]PZM78749.1 MAG: Lrp/AsnC family transcriptional regulator [Candidatus Margulisiibacteriota bacterium]HAR63349.1 AsnC family transcriptional regulator [Candidatus Margulisiibacteriota bacterium]